MVQDLFWCCLQPFLDKSLTEGYVLLLLDCVSHSCLPFTPNCAFNPDPCAALLLKEMPGASHLPTIPYPLVDLPSSVGLVSCVCGRFISNATQHTRHKYLCVRTCVSTQVPHKSDQCTAVVPLCCSGVSSTTFFSFRGRRSVVLSVASEIMSPVGASVFGANGEAAGLDHVPPPLPPRGLFQPWFLRA